MIEIFIAAVIIGIAIYTFYRNFQKKKNGGCGCGNCSK